MSAPDDPVQALVREADFGRWASTLFAPANVRPHLLALYAFDIELSRVRDLVSEPMPGEIRLQWWRDAIEDPERADAAAHPVARALEGAIVFGRLPRAALVAIIDARIDDLYDDPVATMGELEGRIGATASAALRLACLIAAEGRDPGGPDVAGLGGVAQGIARMLKRLPRDAARGQVLLPADRMAAHGITRDEVVSGRATPGLSRFVTELKRHARDRLGEARRAYALLDKAAAPAVLPLSLIESDIARMAGGALFAPVAEARGWRTIWRIWAASRREPPF